MGNKFLALLVVTGLAGCNTLDGLNAKGSFDCKAPDGVVCDSMTGVMANAQANNLPGQQVNRNTNKTPVKGSQFSNVRAKPTSSVLPTMEYTGAPILRNPKTLRVWVAPWEGADRTLFDQQFFYIVIDNWRWNIEHNTRRVREAFAPSSASAYVTAPQQNQASTSSKDSYSYRVEGNKFIPEGNSPEPAQDSINPMQGKTKSDMGADATKELQKMNVDISQFTKPLAGTSN